MKRDPTWFVRQDWKTIDKRIEKDGSIVGTYECTTTFICENCLYETDNPTKECPKCHKILIEGDLTNERR